MEMHEPVVKNAKRQINSERAPNDPNYKTVPSVPSDWGASDFDPAKSSDRAINENPDEVGCPCTEREEEKPKMICRSIPISMTGAVIIDDSDMAGHEDRDPYHTIDESLKKALDNADAVKLRIYSITLEKRNKIMDSHSEGMAIGLQKQMYLYQIEAKCYETQQAIEDIRLRGRKAERKNVKFVKNFVKNVK
ncbi:hypothetical protein QR680_006896 [Steinernema hermaphroditum]|uniref:Uncharacterized protein n=1 Tax=Steinernema hermaphroditum TaxID=289476 RepID=A0AA39HWW6_9BILA|nr:hypothetical protein QR680_006896 [Steinernema hermaphroditum]